MQADVAGLVDQVGEHRHRVARRGRHQFVVVDDHEDLGARPPRPVAQLLLRDVRPWEPGAHGLGRLLQHRAGGGRRRVVADQVLRLDLPQQRAPVVDDDDLGFLRREPGRDALQEAPQQVRLATLGPTDRHEVRFVHGLEVDGRQFEFVDGVRDPLVGRRADRGKRREVQALRKQAHLGGARALPGRVDGGDELPLPRADVGGVLDPVDARQADHGVQAARHDAAAGPGDGDDGLDLAVDLRVERVAELQLDARLERVLRRRPDLGPLGRRDPHVDAEAEAAVGERLDLRLERLELGLERRPAVDDEEHVGREPVGRNTAVAAALPVGGHRVDAQLCELHLSARPERGDLCDRATHPVDVEATGHGPDVCQVAHRREGAAAEVEAVETDLLRSMGERHARNARAQRHRLARLRAADDAEVAARAVEADPPRVAALLPGAVDQAERGREHPPERRIGGLQATPFDLREPAEQLVHRGRLVERRQPHLVRGPAVPLEATDRDAQQRLLLVVLLLLDDGLHLGAARRLHRGLVDLRRRRHHRHDVVGGELDHRRGPALRLDDHLVDGAILGRSGGRRAVPRPGDVGGLEPGHAGGVELQVTVAGRRGQFVGVGHADDGARLGGRERAQRDPVRQEGVEAAELVLLESLRGEQLVDGDRAADAADLHEQVDELGSRGQQLGELVDNDEEAWHGRDVGARLARVLVVLAVLEVARLAQHLHAPVQLAADGVGHPVDERKLALQVGDDGRHVRQVLEAEEGGAALEVDEDEVELFGGVRHG